MVEEVDLIVDWSVVVVFDCSVGITDCSAGAVDNVVFANGGTITVEVENLSLRISGVFETVDSDDVGEVSDSDDDVVADVAFFETPTYESKISIAVKSHY